MLIPALAQASTYYVSIYGSDYNSCDDAQSPYSPKRSVTAGAACLRGGDTLTIGDGTYAEQLANNIPSGSAGAPTIVQAANRNQVILQPSGSYYVVHIDNESYITIDGIVADAAYMWSYPYFIDSQSTHITLKNGTARNGADVYGSGIVIGRPSQTPIGFSSYAEILNMDSYDNGTSGGWVTAHGVYVGSSNNIIDGNRFYNNAGFGIQLYSGSGGVNSNIVRNNEVYGQPTGSVVIATGYGNQFYNNVVHNNGKGLVIMGNSQIITGNTIYSNGLYCIQLFESSHWVENNSCFWNSIDSIFDEVTGTTIVNNMSGAAPPSGGSSSGGNTGGSTESSSGGDTASTGGSTSGGGTYTSGDPLTAPAVLVSQCNYDGTFTLSWDSVPGADNYYVRIDYLNDNVWDSYDYYLDGYGGTTITGSVISGQYYGWWVHGGNSSGIGPYNWSTFMCE